jgi:hypothetical protein
MGTKDLFLDTYERYIDEITVRWLSTDGSYSQNGKMAKNIGGLRETPREGFQRPISSIL